MLNAGVESGAGGTLRRPMGRHRGAVSTASQPAHIVGMRVLQSLERIKRIGQGVSLVSPLRRSVARGHGNSGRRGRRTTAPNHARGCAWRHDRCERLRTPAGSPSVCRRERVRRSPVLRIVEQIFYPRKPLRKIAWPARAIPHVRWHRSSRRSAARAWYSRKRRHSVACAIGQRSEWSGEQTASHP
jgi:hypothetical protein